MANDIDKNIETEEEAEIESTLEQTDKKCPSCGGTLDFDPQTGNLVCPYCGNIVEIEKDDYHSETRYMNSHLVHGNKAIRNN